MVATLQSQILMVPLEKTQNINTKNSDHTSWAFEWCHPRIGFTSFAPRKSLSQVGGFLLYYYMLRPKQRAGIFYLFGKHYTIITDLKRGEIKLSKYILLMPYSCLFRDVKFYTNDQNDHNLTKAQKSPN